jgi:hypothetical protein
MVEGELMALDQPGEGIDLGDELEQREVLLFGVAPMYPPSEPVGVRADVA